MEQQYRQEKENLLSEIRAWNNTENLCCNVYSEDDLKSRTFKKLKMQEYQRLHKKYKSSLLSIDEQMLHRMLRYKSRQLEKELYPSLIRKLTRRLVVAIRDKTITILQGAMEASDLLASDLMLNSLSNNNNNNNIQHTQQPGIEEIKSTSDNSIHTTTEQKQPKPEGWWVNDLGSQSKTKHTGQKIGLH